MKNFTGIKRVQKVIPAAHRLMARFSAYPSILSSKNFWFCLVEGTTRGYHYVRILVYKSC